MGLDELMRKDMAQDSLMGKDAAQDSLMRKGRLLGLFIFLPTPVELCVSLRSSARAVPQC